MPARTRPSVTSLVKARLEAGVALHQAGSVTQACAAYAEALELQPDNPEALRLQGVGLAALGRVAEAQAAFAKALRLRPNFPEVHYNLANALQAQKRLPEAIASYREALRLRPHFVEAQCNLGNALMATDGWAEAEQVYLQALRLRPGYGAVLSNLSEVYRRLGRFEEAIDAAARAVAASPRNGEAHNNLGIAFRMAGRREDAVDAYRAALALDARQSHVQLNLGLVLDELGRHEEAISAFRAALAVNRFLAEAELGLGFALQNLGRWGEARAAYERCLVRNPRDLKARTNLGTTFQKEERFDEAIAQYRQVLSCDPKLREAANNLGTALQSARRWDEAGGVLRALVEREPDYADAWSNFGVALGLQHELAASEQAFRRALELAPGHAEAHNNLANLLLSSGRVYEAVDSYRAAAALDPRLVSACFNEGVAHLLTGNFERGWPLYEHRFAKRTEAERNRFAAKPRWLGEPLAGRTILVHAEQGLGDTLQFMRYIPLLAARGARVHVEVQPALLSLLANFPGAVSVRGRGEALPEFDCHCPMLSLPLGFGTILTDLPAPRAYLPAPVMAGPWMGCGEGRRVGFVWAGNPKHENDHNRSLRLAELEPLFAAAPGVQFFSLQKEVRPDDAARLARHPNVTDLSPFLGDFACTAAAIGQMDLVISVDTSVAHLAGGLGIPLWVLLPFGPDWRWLLQRTDSPWYPSARLFRQRSAGRWEAVVGQVAAELALEPATAALAAPR